MKSNQEYSRTIGFRGRRAAANLLKKGLRLNVWAPTPSFMRCAMARVAH
jgi:hypothetical protein